MVIDGHTHLLQRFGHLKGLDISVQIEQMQKSGIDKAVLFTTEGFFSDMRDSNNQILNAYRLFPNEIIPFCTIDPRKENALDEMERCRDEGMRGLKFHPWLQAIPIVDDQVLKIAEKASTFGWPILSHDGTPPYCTSLQVAYLAECLPQAKIILGHSGMKDFAREALVAAQKYQNIYLGFCGATFQAMQIAVKKVGAERCIFGSDFPFAPIEYLKYTLSQINQLHLCLRDKINVMGGNMLRLLS